MTAARTRFLDGGWYSPLRQALCDLALTHAGPSYTILDAGCGEGYYTENLFSVFHNAGRSFQLAGVDLSKSALKKAARRVPAGEFAVASVYHLPVAGASVDLLVDCFAPLALDEYRRVLRPGGTLLYVVPGPRHLIELKRVLYDRPYENLEQDIPYDGFTPLGVTPGELPFYIRPEVGPGPVPYDSLRLENPPGGSRSAGGAGRPGGVRLLPDSCLPAGVRDKR